MVFVQDEECTTTRFKEIDELFHAALFFPYELRVVLTIILPVETYLVSLNPNYNYYNKNFCAQCFIRMLWLLCRNSSVILVGYVARMIEIEHI